MKRILLLLCLTFWLSVTNAQNNEIQWLDLEAAIAAQKTVPKKIIMDVYTTWCGPCKYLDMFTFQNPDVIDYINENYYAVKFNAEGNEVVTYREITYSNPGFDSSRTGRNSQHQLAQTLNISVYPTIVFFNENADPLMPIKGYKTPSQLELYLKFFSNDDHLRVNSKEEWLQYQRAFVPVFAN